MWVQPLGQEDPLEKGMATHFSILAWRIAWIEEPGVFISPFCIDCKWCKQNALVTHQLPDGVSDSKVESLGHL